MLFVIGLLYAWTSIPVSTAESDHKDLDTLLEEIRQDFLNGDLPAALEKMEQALDTDPHNARVVYTAGRLNEGVRNFERALLYLNRAVRYDPDFADAWQARAVIQFQLGRFEESVDDFDRYLELVPEEKPNCWQRGIACYYAGDFEKGAAQFALHQTVNTNDVENAFWHFLCLSRIKGVEEARKKILPVENDSRVPMMTIYRLIQGKATPLDVLNAVHKDNPDPRELRNRQCYAHLYLGLYDEARGDSDSAYDHFKAAATDYSMPHFMGDVARVHFEILKEQKKSEP